MEITDKDFELVDNYLDGTLSSEEKALFHIRMQDEEFAGLVRFQQELRKELFTQGSERESLFHADRYYQEYRLHRKKRLSDTFNSKWWFLAAAILCFGTLLAALLF